MLARLVLPAESFNGGLPVWRNAARFSNSIGQHRCLQAEAPMFAGRRK
jgi:hypothetical protein